MIQTVFMVAIGLVVIELCWRIGEWFLRRSAKKNGWVDPCEEQDHE